MSTINHVNSNRSAILSGLKNSQHGKQKVHAEASGTQIRSGGVSLSDEAKNIGQLQQSLATESQFDTNKVEAIKQAIAEGRYQIDPEKLADSIIMFGDEFKTAD